MTRGKARTVVTVVTVVTEWLGTYSGFGVRSSGCEFVHRSPLVAWQAASIASAFGAIASAFGVCCSRFGILNSPFTLHRTVNGELRTPNAER